MKGSPLMIVARPLAVPIPRPRIAFGPTRLNLSYGIQKPNTYVNGGLAHIGAF